MTRAARFRSRIRRGFHGASLLVAAALAGTGATTPVLAAADPPPGPAFFFQGIIGDDDRIALDATDPPFNAIGRLNVSGFSALRQCTGFLIAPDIVVTAAHCVMDAFRGKPLAAARFHFLPGWQKQTYLAHGIGKCIGVMQGFRTIPKPTLENMGLDVAFIVLREKIEISPLATDETLKLTEKTSLVHTGYSRDKQHLLMGDADCNVLDENEHVILTDCDTNRGASGGPVLALTPDGEFKAVAMMVGGFAKEMNVAVKLSAVADFLKNAKCN